VPERPKAHIQVIGPRDRERRATHHCRLDQQIRLDHDRIQRSFPTLLTHRDLDLLTVVGSVGFADRAVPRRRSSGWGRDLQVSIPVSDPDFWARGVLQNALTECLSLLTGDTWQIDFTRLKIVRPLQPSLHCDPKPFADVSCVIPYSGGLDSLAGLQLWQAANPNKAALRIGTDTNRDVGEVIRRTTEGWRGTEPVSVQLVLATGEHPEATYRTRTFVFFSTAMLAAKLASVSRVLVMENGQGALGPSLVPMGDEWPYRSTHPLFTESLHRLLVHVWNGEAPVFEHPHLWKTKGELLREAARAGDTDAWRKSRSCSRNPRRNKGKGAAPSCGLCGGCILRRSSLVAAGLGALESDEDFVWKDLSRPTLEESGCVKIAKSDRTIATTNILDMRALCGTATEPPATSVLRVADEVAGATRIGYEEAMRRVKRLVEQHRLDWNAFLDHLGPLSWVTELGRP